MRHIVVDSQRDSLFFQKLPTFALHRAIAWSTLLACIHILTCKNFSRNAKIDEQLTFVKCDAFDARYTHSWRLYIGKFAATQCEVSAKLCGLVKLRRSWVCFWRACRSGERLRRGVQSDALFDWWRCAKRGLKYGESSTWTSVEGKSVSYIDLCRIEIWTSCELF